MNGRLDNERKIIEGTERKVNKMPNYVRSWYLTLRASKNTAATCRDYINKVFRFLEFINADVKNVKLNDITQETVIDYIISIQTKEEDGNVKYTSDSYQQTTWCCLHNFFNYLVENKLKDRNYLNTITKPKNKDLDRINENRILLTAKDFKKIVRSVDVESNIAKRARNRAILLMFMNTGLRRTALCSITLNDIDIADRILTVIDKGNKRLTYVLNDQVVDAVNEWMLYRDKYNKNNLGYLFLSDKGNGIAPSTVYDIVGKYTELALGKKISPHKLRSGYCSILYKKTGDIEFVRRAVGHANATTTQRYIVTKGEEKRKASEIMGNIF